jgi:hypothetical protein
MLFSFQLRSTFLGTGAGCKSRPRTPRPGDVLRATRGVTHDAARDWTADIVPVELPSLTSNTRKSPVISPAKTTSPPVTATAPIIGLPDG